MSYVDEQAVDARYMNSFGRIAGYLPRNRAAVDAWHEDLSRKIEEQRATVDRILSPSVAALKRLIEHDGIVRMYVSQMIDQVSPPNKHVKDIPDLLVKLDDITRTAPQYNWNPADQVFFPVSALFTYMMMTKSGEAAFRNDAFNGAIRAILQEWCGFLDSPASRQVLNESEYGWLSQPAYQQNNLSEFEIPDRAAPHWGFTSFNHYFHRQIQPEFRPIASPDDPKVIVSANDGSVFNYVHDAQRLAKFWLKAEPYSLVNMLDGSEHTERFVGGAVFQSFLSGADYHRWHSPIDGVVLSARVVHGLMFSDAESAGSDPTAGTYSQGYDASVNTRGLVFVESPDPAIGIVCVIPIGMAEISSVSFTVEAGQRVKKGQELGYFSYGGSGMCLVFQRGAIARFIVPPPPTPSAGPGWQDMGASIFVNAQIAVAN
jgi:phosphatidylserine decarboxylase